jgi:hypothetical protein
VKVPPLVAVPPRVVVVIFPVTAPVGTSRVSSLRPREAEISHYQLSHKSVYDSAHVIGWPCSSASG